MKNLYYFLFTIAIITNIKMKIKEFDFEKQHQMEFNIFDFELPHGKENLQNKINQWNSSEQKAFLNEQLSLDYIFMSTLFPAVAHQKEGIMNKMWAKKLITKGYEVL